MCMNESKIGVGQDLQGNLFSVVLHGTVFGLVIIRSSPPNFYD